MKRVNSHITVFTLTILILLLSSNHTDALVPFSYEFTDEDNDGLFYKYQQTVGLTESDNHNFDAIELLSVGYNLERQKQLMTVYIKTLGTPIVNESFFYSFEMTLESSESLLSIRVLYSIKSGGFALEESNVTRIDLFYETPGQNFDQGETITTKISGNTIYWEINQKTVDIVRAFDDPTMLISRVTAEIEYNINGSSSFAFGDFYRDDFRRVEFDFVGGVQATPTDLNFFDIIDPLAMSIYFGIPMVILFIKIIRKILEFQKINPEDY